MTHTRARALRTRKIGAQRLVLLAILILAGSGPVRAIGTKKPQGLRPPSGQATVFKATRPTPAHALPDLKSRILFVARSGELLTVVTSGVRVPDAPSWSTSGTCCSQGSYDPDQQTDVVDRVGEGYVPVFHDGLYPGGTFAAAPSGCGHGTDSGNCGRPVTFLEPNGLGLWVQVMTRDGRQRAWILTPSR